MSDFEADGRELWRRYRVAAMAPAGMAGPADALASAPGPVLLAAWLDGRLDEAAAEPVEAWLARTPDALALVAPVDTSDAPAPLELIRRARALVPGNGGGAAARPTWRNVMAWASVAASLVLVGATGFMAGHDAVGDSHETVASL
ncbi:MAG: hypothetical protein JO021_02495, partial [Alphaproteobacteria bacterium]|nr:hypothetical protein [Alphaproteobacteria bacterium]